MSFRRGVMSLVKCHECGNEVSSEAKTCPKCGAVPKTSKNTISAIVTLVVVGGMAWYLFGGGLEKEGAKEMARIEQSVADDAVKQYDIAKREGDAMQVCVQAGFVAAAYLQAKEEGSYERWKGTEKADCRRAGVPN
jgi:hypothetical protein